MDSWDRDIFLSTIFAFTILIGGMLSLDAWGKWNDYCAANYNTRNDIDCFILRKNAQTNHQ